MTDTVLIEHGLGGVEVMRAADNHQHIANHVREAIAGLRGKPHAGIADSVNRSLTEKLLHAEGGFLVSDAEEVGSRASDP
eukprot:5761976-Lingulodinium_polyedra.AAC.1